MVTICNHMTYRIQASRLNKHLFKSKANREAIFQNIERGEDGDGIDDMPVILKLPVEASGNCRF